MDFNTIITAIGSVGFPIIGCVVIAWFFYHVNENYRNDIKELSNSHKEESKMFADVISQNNIVLQKLCDKLDNITK